MGAVSVCTLLYSSINQSMPIILRLSLMIKVENKWVQWQYDLVQNQEKPKTVGFQPWCTGNRENTFSRLPTMCEALCKQMNWTTNNRTKDGWCEQKEIVSYQYFPLEGAPAFVLDSVLISMATCSLRSLSGRCFSTAAQAQSHFTQVSFFMLHPVRTMQAHNAQVMLPVASCKSPSKAVTHHGTELTR